MEIFNLEDHIEKKHYCATRTIKKNEEKNTYNQKNNTNSIETKLGPTIP